MKLTPPLVIATIVLLAVSNYTHAQKQVSKSDQFTEHLTRQFQQDTAKAYQLARQRNWPIIERVNGNIIQLMRISPNGLPEYVSTESNVVAAITTSTSQLWHGGTTGLNLSGAGVNNNLHNKIAIWDGGLIRTTHDELKNKVTIMDAATTNSDHATHVAGTMVGRGVNAAARGMSYGATGLLGYDFSNDQAEMNSMASQLLVSNHSYGTIAGWSYNQSNSRWQFYGEWGANEDYNFGFYDNSSMNWDSIAFNNPYYLAVKSSGNNRSNSNGPAVGSPYWRRDVNGTWTQIMQREPELSSNNWYDIISTYGNAKNNLTVGAVNAIPLGYAQPSDVVISSFSSWGPTDDGRIKPDIVGNGVNITSSITTSDNAYGTMSGTSMSAPNVSGSLFLLQELYNKQNQNQFMRSATLKGVVIHTALESGSAPGPDYVFGWGLLNTTGAANVIRNHQNNHTIAERRLNQGADTTFTVVASGNGPLTVTICWTDPPGTVDFQNRYNNRTPKLINDLDIRVSIGATVFRPWILDPENPIAAATTGDNFRDNVEKIEIPNAVAGVTYTIRISHKNNLRNGFQNYSLIMSGINGNPYCTSAPSSTADSRIDNVTFGTIINNIAAGCSQYRDYTNISTTLSPGQTIPVSVALGTCGAAKDKIAKVFIDWNGNGSFADAGETVATSGVISGTATFSANVTIPSTLPVGLRTRMRVVLMETTNATAVVPCGTYTGGGETQDYTIMFGRATLDVTPVALRGLQETCGVDSQYLSVQLQNIGSSITSSQIIAETVIKQNNTVVATLKDTMNSILLAGELGTIAHSKAFATAPATTYSVETTISMFNEVNTGNNRITSTFTTGAAYQGTITGSGQVCSGTLANLVANASPATNLIWYPGPTATTPVAAGTQVSVSSVPANRTYYVGANDYAGRVGPTDKLEFAEGGYNAFSPGITITARMPLLIESARIFTGNPGRLVFSVLDSNYSIVSTSAIDVRATNPNPQHGAVNGNPADDHGMIIPLNLRLPAAGNYVIRVSFEKGVTLYRNNNIPLSPALYPIVVPGVMAITGHEATVTTTDFYYYLYNMKVRSLGCPSGTARTAVVANAPLTPVISANGNTLSSSVTEGGITWYRNDTIIPNATAVTFAATQNGNYKVQHSVNGCVFESPSFAFVVTSVSNLSPAAIGMRVTPNPFAGEALLQYTSPVGVKNAFVQVLSYEGKVVLQEKLPTRAGSVQLPINMSSHASGIYLLKVFLDNKQYMQKIVLQR